MPWLQRVKTKHRQSLRGDVDPVVPVGDEETRKSADESIRSC